MINFQRPSHIILWQKIWSTCNFDHEISRIKFLNAVANFFGGVVGPKYDGEYLRSITRQILGNTTLKQTITDVIIPTFDIKRLQPTIFTTDDVISDHLLLSTFLMIYQQSVIVSLICSGKRVRLERCFSIGRMHKHLRRSDVFPASLFRDHRRRRSYAYIRSDRRRGCSKQSGKFNSI